MNLTKRLTACFLTLVMVFGLIPQTVFAQETVASLLQYEVNQEMNEDKTEAAISIKFTETETIQLEKVTLPDGTEKAEDLSEVTYTVSKNGNYDFKINYSIEGTQQEEIIPIEVLGLGEKKTETVANQDDELGIDIQLKGATFFDGTPWSGTTQKMIEYNEEVPYNGWQLMQLAVEIPYQSGLEITNIQPSAESIYPEYSKLKKDDKNSKWTYTYYFYDNGTYNFTINYFLNGAEHSVTKSHTVEGLVSIKDVAMRRHLINNYGEFTGLSYQDGQYITEDILATPQYDPWGNLVFDFGKDGDNGSTAKYTTSLDGLQYLKNIHGMYLFDCSRLAKGETIEPITNTYYPNMKQLRITEISENRTNLPEGSYTPEMIAKAISNMPNLGELSLSGTGFKDFSVVNQLNGQLYYVKCNYNEVESIDGIQKHKEIGTLALGKNKIKSIEPLGKSNFDDLRFLDLGGNQIFDLSPMKTTLPNSIMAGRTFSAKGQNIIYDKNVITPLENGEYKVELPMPIDIDGTLTDTTNVTVKYGDGNSKQYNTTKLDGRTYISIPQNDTDSSQENPFKDAEFTFAFNNNNGTDNRTKSWFTGTVSFKASPIANEYRVIYDFVSGTRGKSLPSEVTSLLPMDFNKYTEGVTITAKKPTKTVIEVADGIWTFEGYDTDNKIANSENVNEDGNIQFVGTWVFETKKYNVNYKFESTNKNKELPKEITNQLPLEESVEHGKSVNAPNTKFDDVVVTDGVWTFKGWTPAKYENVRDNVEFVGKWEFKKNASIINQVPVISADDKTIYVGDEFDPLKDVTATDKEDGDMALTIENVIKNEVDNTKVGVYEVTYKVTDSQGASTVKTIKVTVKAKDGPVVPSEPNKPNTPNDSNKPIIVPDTSVNDKNPQTGDSINMTLWSLLFIASSVGLVGIYRKKRKTDQ